MTVETFCSIEEVNGCYKFYIPFIIICIIHTATDTATSINCLYYKHGGKSIQWGTMNNHYNLIIMLILGLHWTIKGFLLELCQLLPCTTSQDHHGVFILPKLWSSLLQLSCTPYYLP